MAAGTEVGAINVAIRADVSDFDAGTRAVLTSLTGLENSVKNTVKPVDSLWTSLGSVKGQLATLGVTAAVGSIVALTKSAIDNASALKDASDRIGVNVEALQELDYAAGQVGISTSTLQNAISIFTRNLGDARNGVGSLAEGLRKTNPELLNLVRNAGSVEAALDVAFTAIANAGDQTEKAALAVKFFGRSGTQLLPILADGTKGLADMRARARELGLVISADLVEGADKAGDRLTELGKVVKTNLQAAMLEAAPFIEDTTVALIDLGLAAGKVFGAINDAIREDFANQQIAFEIRTEYGSVDAAKARLAELQEAIAALQAVPRTELSVEGAQTMREMQFEVARIAELLGVKLPEAAKKGGDATAGAADKATDAVAGLGRASEKTVDGLVARFPEIGEAIDKIEFESAKAGLTDLEVALRENERAAEELGLKYGLTATEIELASVRMQAATRQAFATEALTAFQLAMDNLDFETSLAGLTPLQQEIARTGEQIRLELTAAGVAADVIEAKLAENAVKIRENWSGDFFAESRAGLERINHESQIFNEITNRNATELEKLQQAQDAANQRVVQGTADLLEARETFGEFSTEALVAQNNLRLFAKEAEQAAADTADLEDTLDDTADGFAELGDAAEKALMQTKGRSYELGVAIEDVEAQLRDMIDAADPDALREFADEMRDLAQATIAATSAGSPFETFLKNNANQLYAAAQRADDAALSYANLASRIDDASASMGKFSTGYTHYLHNSDAVVEGDWWVNTSPGGIPITAAEAAALSQLSAPIDYDEVRDELADLRGEVVLSVKATGSPTMDFSDYFQGYIPRLLDDLESDVAKRALVLEAITGLPAAKAALPRMAEPMPLLASPAALAAQIMPKPLDDGRTNERVELSRVARAIEMNNAEQMDLKRQLAVLAAALPSRRTETQGRGGF